MEKCKKVKKSVALLLAGAIALMLCSCGKDEKAFEISKTAYDNINLAYESTETIGTDIYEAWRLGIFEKDEMSIDLLASELSLSEDEITKGIALLLGDSEEEMDSVAANVIFSFFEDDMFSLCVEIVKNAYVANGTVEEIQGHLDEAKEQMKELSEEYSDYEHYPNLKGYYTTTNSFFDFCQNPTGSFEQVKTTINDYKNEARDYVNDLN